MEDTQAQLAQLKSGGVSAQATPMQAAHMHLLRALQKHVMAWTSYYVARIPNFAKLALDEEVAVKALQQVR